MENKLSFRAIRIFSRKDLPIYLIVFFPAVALKIVAESIAYPYPIGYDVINYYIPMLSNFENEWNTILGDYPFYTSVLHLVQNLTGLTVQATVSTFAAFIFGLFAVSILALAKAIMKKYNNDNLYAVLISLFVIVQIPVLRTTWDLHRDMFSLTMMIFAISILIRLRNTDSSRFPSLALVTCISFSVLSVVADRMVGVWLIGVYCISVILYRERTIAITFIAALVSFLVLLAVSGDVYSIISSSIRSIAHTDVDYQILGKQVPSTDGYTQANLFSYFIALNIMLLPLGIVGYLQLKESFLRISLIVALVGSMTWLVFPYARELVADRWILLFGISLSIFAGYGFIKTIQLMSTRLRNIYLRILASGMIFLIFAQFGIIYAVLPYEAQVSVIGLFNKNIQDFAPKSMQFNSVEADQSHELLDIIHWVNENTPARSKIIGSNDWRGWFILELTGNRSFVAYERMGEIFRNMTYDPNDQGYLIDTKVSDDPVNQRMNSVLERAKAYSNSLFTVYRIWEFPKNVNLIH
ncbi:MAG: hypothetical protein ACRD8Z_17575 [Nitrososphaeraceae archaeon]